VVVFLADMRAITHLLSLVLSRRSEVTDLVLEDLALRQQLAVL
jgi:hypothetical protein